jgi:hypothetical protein
MDDSRPPSSERRSHHRYELLAQVHVEHASVDYVLALGNLSQSGALLCFGSLAKPAWVRLDRMVEVAIVNPETYDSVCLHGRIVRVHTDAEGHGFAVEFSKPDHVAREGLLGLIQLAKRSRTDPPSLPGT